jgi:hypothetical protein
LDAETMRVSLIDSIRQQIVLRHQLDIARASSRNARRRADYWQAEAMLAKAELQQQTTLAKLTAWKP